MNVTAAPGGRNIAIKTAFVNASALGSTVVLAATTGGIIRVLSLVVVTTLANNIKLLSAATDITATYPLGANGGIVMPFTEIGWVDTNESEALNINMSVATPTGITVRYIIV